MTDADWKAIFAGLGALLMTIGTIFGRSFVRRMWSRDRAIIASDGAEASVTQMLQDDIARRRNERTEELTRHAAERADLNARVDKFAQERNELIEKNAELKQKVHDAADRILVLSNTIERLERSEASYKEEAEGLRAQVRALMERVGRDLGPNANLKPEG